MKYTVSPNAFSSVAVHGLVSNHGVPIEQTFYRGIVKPGLQILVSDECIRKPGGIPPRPPSRLPPPGNQRLTISLGDELGRGRVGSVRVVNMMEPDIELPPLVAKISYRKRFADIAQEAWFYEELEQVQGVSVPCCYGFFQTRLRDGDSVSTWDLAEDEDDNDNDDEDIEHYLDGWRSKKQSEREYEKGLPGEGPILSILLLERLGGKIPVGKPVDSIKDDVYELFHDLALLGIEILDIRWSNILSAHIDSEPLAGKICPNHGHVHHWRLIDFDHCRKLDSTLRFIDGCNGTWLKTLFHGLVNGYIVEPWGE